MVSSRSKLSVEANRLFIFSAEISSCRRQATIKSRGTTPLESGSGASFSEEGEEDVEEAEDSTKGDVARANVGN